MVWLNGHLQNGGQVYFVSIMIKKRAAVSGLDLCGVIRAAVSGLDVRRMGIDLRIIGVSP